MLPKCRGGGPSVLANNFFFDCADLLAPNAFESWAKGICKRTSAMLVAFLAIFSATIFLANAIDAWQDSRAKSFPPGATR